jgi:hypothetical protein
MMTAPRVHKSATSAAAQASVVKAPAKPTRQPAAKPVAAKSALKAIPAAKTVTFPGVIFNEGEMRAAQLAAFGLSQKRQELARHASPVAKGNKVAKS